MKKIVFLIVGLIVLIDLIYSFTSNQTVGSIFGYEYNIWVYRVFKLTLLLVIATAYYMLTKPKRQN